jgi:hypothetical protein
MIIAIDMAVTSKIYLNYLIVVTSVMTMDRQVGPGEGLGVNSQNFHKKCSLKLLKIARYEFC